MTPVDHVQVQETDFSVAAEYERLTAANTEDGAVVTFVGRMRDYNQGDRVQSLFLEHYPGMTERALQALVTEARARWRLGRVAIIHRVGRLVPADQIVWVGVTSPHRGEAFAAAEYLMDALKTRAPFWKKEQTEQAERWVEARETDEQRARRWEP